MLTINAEIKKDGLRPDGTYNVKLRFTPDRKMRRLATSLFTTSKDLTKKLKIKRNSPIKITSSSIGKSTVVCPRVPNRIDLSEKNAIYPVLVLVDGIIFILVS